MEEVITLLRDSFPWVATILFGLSLVVEFTKIKFNPWSWLFGAISKALTKDIDKRLDEIVNGKSAQYQEIIDTLNKTTAAIADMNKTIDGNEMARLRWDILSFADSCRSGNIHSKDAFHHIIESNDKYHMIINKHGFVNGVIDAEMAFILDTYKEYYLDNMHPLKKGVIG